MTPTPHRNHPVGVGRLLAMALGIACACAAQAAAPPQVHPTQRASFVVILLRHGVRAPTQTPQALERYAAQPWPHASTPPGDLTAHGARVLTQQGRYYSRWLEHNGIRVNGCGADASWQVITDSDQRTIASGTALQAGMAPSCSAPVTSLRQGDPDPLFDPVAADRVHPRGTDARAALLGRIGEDPALAMQRLQTDAQVLEQVLFDCSDTACRAQQAMRGKHPFMLARPEVVATHDGMAKLKGPLALASMLAGNILLQYEDGVPLADVGWGRASTPQALDALFALHQAASDLVKRTPYLAAARSGNLLAWIGAALAAHAGRVAPPPPANTPAHVVFLVGHDTNLANVQALLGLRWHIPGQPDPYAPGAALVFSLSAGGAGVPQIRVLALAPTLRALRDGTVAIDHGMRAVPVFVPGCSSALPGYPSALPCLLERIREAVPQGFIEPAPWSRLTPSTISLDRH